MKKFIVLSLLALGIIVADASACGGRLFGRWRNRGGSYDSGAYYPQQCGPQMIVEDNTVGAPTVTAPTPANNTPAVPKVIDPVVIPTPAKPFTKPAPSSKALPK